MLQDWSNTLSKKNVCSALREMEISCPAKRNISPTILAELNKYHLHKAAEHLKQPNPALSEK